MTTEESNGTTRVYDVTTGSAVEVAELPALGDLSPDGRYYFAAYAGGSGALLNLETDALLPVTGLEGTSDQIHWLDQDTALLGSQDGRGNGDQVSVLFSCEVATLNCEEIYASSRDIRLES